MRTTIDLPDELLRQVKARAALNGLRLKDTSPDDGIHRRVVRLTDDRL